MTATATVKVYIREPFGGGRDYIFHFTAIAESEDLLFKRIDDALEKLDKEAFDIEINGVQYVPRGWQIGN